MVKRSIFHLEQDAHTRPELAVLPELGGRLNKRARWAAHFNDESDEDADMDYNDQPAGMDEDEAECRAAEILQEANDEAAAIIEAAKEKARDLTEELETRLEGLDEEIAEKTAQHNQELNDMFLDSSVSASIHVEETKAEARRSAKKKVSKATRILIEAIELKKKILANEVHQHTFKHLPAELAALCSTYVDCTGPYADM